MFSFYTTLEEIIHEGPSSDSESQFVPILKFFVHSGSENRFFKDFYNKNAHNFTIFLPILMKIYQVIYFYCNSNRVHQ